MELGVLNSIIHLKQWREDELKRQLIKIKSIIAEHERTIQNLEDEFSRKVEEAVAERQKEIEPQALRDFHNYLEDLTRLLQEKKNLLQRRIQELKQTEQYLLQAYQSRKVMESVKDRIIKERQRATRRAECKLLDELSLRRDRG